MKSQKGIRFEYLLALFVLALAGFFIYQQYLAIKPKPVAQVQCGPVLVSQYGLAGTQVTQTLKVVDTKGNAVAGANVYSFDTKPYYWDKPELFQYLGSVITGVTPVATTDANGQANISVTVPETSSVSYVVLQASGYWTEPYVFTVSINPLLAAESETKCLEVYTYATVQQILPSLVKVEAKRLVDGKVFGLKNLQVTPLATYTTVNPVSFGVSKDQLGANLKGVSTFYISSGELRVTDVKINATANLRNEGIKQISLRINIAGTEVFNGLVFDTLNSNLPLKDGAQGTEYTINVPNGLIRAGEGQSVVVEVNVIADTSAYAAAGDNRLGPGEQILAVSLQLAHPLTGQPIVVPVRG